MPEPNSYLYILLFLNVILCNYKCHRVNTLVKKYLGRYTLAYGLTDADLLQFANEILEEKLQYDIENLVNRDPAAKAVSDSYSYVLNNYKGVQAIIYYRIANKLIYDDDFYDQINSNYQDELEVAPER